MIQGLARLFRPEPDPQHDQKAHLKASFKQLPTLSSERLLLRAPRMSDAADYYAYARDPENSRYVLWEPHRSILDSRSALRSLISQNRRGLPATFAIELKAEARMIGTIGFQWIDLDSMTAELGYTIARRLWNHGLATEALKRLSAYAFDELGLRKLEARHDIRNPASGRVMLRAGFHLEDREPQSLWLKGRMADLDCYALYREEHQAT